MHGDPAECLRVDEVARLPAPLPQPVVGIAPALNRVLDKVDEEAPVIVVWRVAALVPAPALLEQMPVGVELELLRRVVADADDPAAAEPGELLDLGHVHAPLAADAVEDLEIAGAGGGAPLDEAPKRVGLRLVAEPGERAGGEHRVAHPRVAIVPGARAVGRLRQRRRRGRHDRARRRIRKRLDDERGAQHARFVDRADARAPRPCAPGVDRPLQPAVERLRLGRVGAGVELLGRPILEQQPHPLARPHRRPGRERLLVVGRERRVAPAQQAVVAADQRVDAGAVVADPRHDLAVVEARRDKQPQRHGAAHAVDDAQDRPPVGHAVALAVERHTVEQPRLAAGCAQRRGEH